MKKKELFVVDPGLHTQNCRDVTKMHSKREKNDTSILWRVCECITRSTTWSGHHFGRAVRTAVGTVLVYYWIHSAIYTGETVDLTASALRPHWRVNPNKTRAWEDHQVPGFTQFLTSLSFTVNTDHPKGGGTADIMWSTVQPGDSQHSHEFPVLRQIRRVWCLLGHRLGLLSLCSFLVQ
jgi:hypothetical protein